MSEWCILRCASANTIPLSRSLARAGLHVWTPIQIVTKRVPRANVKRQVEEALLPSYLFAAADELPGIIEITEQPVSDHRDFRVFYANGRIPVIADATLAPLRLLERKRKVVGSNAIKAGDSVRLDDGALAGMSGVVEKAGSQFATVRLQGFNLPLKIANFYLLREQEDSAKAA